MYAIASLILSSMGTELGAGGKWLTFAALLIPSHFFLAWYKRQVSEDFRQVCKRAVVPLQTPIIILGGILVGVFTPTEASVVAVVYALLISFFLLRSMKLGDLPSIFMKSALGSSTVLLLVGAAVAFKTVVSLSHAPEIMADFILGLSDNPLMLLFLINILLFIVGMFLDAGPAIIILGPILGPIFVDIGVHPVHFAIIMSVNLTVGLATHPWGWCCSWPVRCRANGWKPSPRRSCRSWPSRSR